MTPAVTPWSPAPMSDGTKEAVERMVRGFLGEADALDAVTIAFGDASKTRIAKAGLLRANAEALRTLLTRAEAADAAGHVRGVREAAAVCKQQQTAFLSPEYATNQPLSSFNERFACGECEREILALLAPAATDEGEMT